MDRATDFCVEVTTKAGLKDARATTLERRIAMLGLAGVTSVEVADRYYLRGQIGPEDVAALADTLLHDPIIEDTHTFLLEEDALPAGDGYHIVDVVLHAGVTDSTAESLLTAATEIGIKGVVAAATGTRYTINGSITVEFAEMIATTLLANDAIQHYFINEAAPPPHVPIASNETAPQGALVDFIPLADLDTAALQELSTERRLSLDAAEMSAIRSYFGQVGRAPTDLELEMLAQTWSEHCVHKTFRALIEYTGPPPGATQPLITTTVDSILNSHIRAATESIDKPWVRSAFVDDAGIVALDDQTDLAFKVETHNHPSALEPFGGANTGVGGVVRDVIGVSARPIANTDILCFGPLDTPADSLPDGVLHPMRIEEGVVAGIEDYGNKMGIPTVNGAVVYDPGYTANPLVFCGCLGVLPAGSHPTEPRVGDRIVVLGGRIGRDGLRGATFSSMESDHTTGELSGSAVQIGHPIHEKQVLEAIMVARDEGLYNAITDCGAGGLSSSVGEMAAELGAIVHLERAPLKYPGLEPWEIWLSEAQERMVIAVRPDKIPRVADIASSLDVEMTVLGEFTGDGVMRILYDDETVGEIDCDFLHNGMPRLELTAKWEPPLGEAGPMPDVADPTDTLLALLSSPNIASKEHIVRQYDHEVRGGTVGKPFAGPQSVGPMDAAVIAPLPRRHQNEPVAGAALAVGLNPAYGRLDPYNMAWAAVDEAVRNVVAVGANPDRISILDNFSWGNPRLADRLGTLVRCTQGCHDAAVTYRTPFISGKDSLNNEYTGSDGRKHTIPGTLVISALGVVPDIALTVSSDLKQPGNDLYIIGNTGSHLGGSALAEFTGWDGGASPAPVPDAIETYLRLHRAIAAGLIASCHDVSEGGIAVAIAEMSIGGDLGADIRLGDIPAQSGLDESATAYSESLGRLVVEVATADAARFEQLMAGAITARIGSVRADDRFSFLDSAGGAFIATTIPALARAWRGHVGRPR